MIAFKGLLTLFWYTRVVKSVTRSHGNDDVIYFKREEGTGCWHSK